MNPVLVFLILISAVFFWFLLAKLFRTIGGATNSFVDDVKNAVYDDDDEEDEE